MPVSLLNMTGKVIDKTVHKDKLKFILDRHAISYLQSGFVPGDSAENQHVVIHS